MYLRKLVLTNARAFRRAEFDFRGEKGVHLLVGVNGVGKSTTLDVLRVMLSRIVPEFVSTKVPSLPFFMDDITQGEPYLGAVLTGHVLEDQPFALTIDRKRDSVAPNNLPISGRSLPRKRLRRNQDEFSEEGATRDAARDAAYATYDNSYFTFIPKQGQKEKQSDAIDFILTKDTLREQIRQNLQESPFKPLAVYYSAHRSRIRNPKIQGNASHLPAYNDALLDERPFNAKVFADWWRAKLVLAEESKDKSEKEALSLVFTEVVTTFLDDCQNLELAPDDDDRYLLITKNRRQLGIKQLSDGERSVLTLTLDLARRLYLANPNLSHPTKEGEAVVLIDELDLHLHPGWQRKIVERLEQSFPACQFIVTTHSPQIIGEVKPERVQLLLSEEETKKERATAVQETPIQEDDDLFADDEAANANQVFTLEKTLGMDSNWILRHIMETDERDDKTKELIQAMFDLLARKVYDQVPVAIAAVEKMTNGEIPDTARAKATLERIKILGR